MPAVCKIHNGAQTSRLSTPAHANGHFAWIVDADGEDVTPRDFDADPAEDTVERKRRERCFCCNKVNVRAEDK